MEDQKVTSSKKSHRPRRPRIPRQKSLICPEVTNPFHHRLHLSPLDKLRIVFMSITIAPLRLILVFILLVPAYFVARIALWGRSKTAEDKPLSGWRRSLKYILIFLGRIQFFVMGYHYVKRIGKMATNKEAPILVVAPHISFFDAIVVFYLDLPSTVSRIENRATPLCGTLLEYLQPVYVSREDPNSRANTIKDIKRRSHSEGEWPQIMIFPEGTCSNGTCLITFKGGAFFPGVPIQPIVFRQRSNTPIWTWDGPGAIKCLWLTLCNFHNGAELEFLPVYTPNEEEKNDSRLFAKNVRAEMANALNIPVTDHTFEDCKLMMDAEARGLPTEVGIVEFSKVLNKLGIKLDTLKIHLKSYSEIAKSGGYIGIDDFAKHLGLPVTQQLQDLFDMYDRDGSGKIDFREYVIGCSLVSQPANTEETFQLAFKMFGGEKGYLNEDDMVRLLQSSFEMADEECVNLFDQVDVTKTGKITYDDFTAFALKKPEYARLFTNIIGEGDTESIMTETTVDQSETDSSSTALTKEERPSSAKKED